MNTQFTLVGGKALEARLRAIGKAPEAIMREVGIRAVAEAKHLVPRRTGNLGRTIRLGTVSAAVVEVRAGGTDKVGYAAAVEFGSKPHVIMPKRRKALAWGGPRTLAGGLRAGGRPTHFARRVDHPGSKPRPYLIPGFEKALRLVGLGELVNRWNRAA